MRHPKPYSRVASRAEVGAWLGQRRRLLVQLLGAGAVFIGSSMLFVRLVFGGRPAGWAIAGALVAATVTGVFWRLHLAFLASHPKAINHIGGAWGEDFTRAELKRARRRRLVWDSVHSINTRHGDVDHLVVTRRAGIVVIDSKFRSSPGAPDREKVLAQARAVKRRAETLMTTVLSRPRASHRGRHRGRARFDVRPVVVLWGPGSRVVSEPTDVDGVTVVAGKDLLDWLREQDGDPIDRDVAKNLVGLLCDWRNEQRRRTALPA